MLDHTHPLPRLTRSLCILAATLALLVGCGANRGVSTDPRTLYEAWELLSDYTDGEDLLLVGYAALLIEDDGRSDDYTLSAYAPDEEALYVLQATAHRIRFYTLPSPTAPPTEPIERIVDSPALVADAVAQMGECREDLSLGINLTDERADALCSQPRWAAKVSPYAD